MDLKLCLPYLSEEAVKEIMKVLIVDDERHVRDAIKMLVPWDQYEISTVLEASDVDSAKEMIQAEKPQIIFLDMMLVNETGTEILQWTNESSIHCKIIVVSGYNDFEYVRSTVRYGGLDYLLKPIDRKKLIDAFEKAVEEWKSDESTRLEKQSNSMKMNQIQPIYWDKTFSEFVKEPTKKASLIREINEAKDLTGKNIQIILLSLKLMHYRIFDRFSSHMDLLGFSIINICNEYLNQSGCGYAFRNWSREHEIGILIWDDHEHSKQLIEQINEGIMKTYGSKFFFAAGGIHAFPQGAAASYKEARTVLIERINLKHTEQWVFDVNTLEISENEAIYMNQYEEKLIYAIKSGQKNMIQTAAGSFVNELRNLHAITLNHIDIWFNELQMIHSKYFKEYESAVQVDFKLLSYLMIDDQGNIKIEEWLNKLEESFILLGHVLSKDQDEKENITYKIVDFIKKHYHEELTLQDISEHFYLSREYISRKFKQDIGENLFSFITNVRVEKACSLLRDTDLKILDIAKMVGFDNEKYFSKVFKKSTGYPPTKFRQAEGLDSDETS
jgi:two-component system response regulator YesN